MGRMSARFIAQKLIDWSASDVYECWKDMGLVVMDKVGGWDLTDLGRNIGGNYLTAITLQSQHLTPIK